MDRYIGLDAHASSCTLGVVGPSGKRLGSHVVETNARALIEVLRGIPGSRHLCLEEGTLAGWLHEVTGSVETTIWFSALCLVLSPVTLLAFRYWQRATATDT